MHVAMWLLWFLWFLRVEYSANPLYKPFCSFLVFVDLVWFLCGSFCGFWSRVVFWSCASTCPQGLRVVLWFCGLALDADACPQGLRFHLPASMPMLARGLVVLWSCPRCRCLPVVLWFCCLVVLPSMPTIARPLARLDADACPWSCGFVVLPSMPKPMPMPMLMLMLMIARPLVEGLC